MHTLDRFPCHVPVDGEGFNWKPAEDTLRYTHASDGDFLLTPFQCDVCVFRNLQQRDPIPGTLQDDLLLCCVRRVTLDAVWGRESSTVVATLQSAKTMIRMWQVVGIPPPLPTLRPHPVEDSFAMVSQLQWFLNLLTRASMPPINSSSPSGRCVQPFPTSLWLPSGALIACGLLAVTGLSTHELIAPLSLCFLKDSAKAVCAEWGRRSARIGRYPCQ